MTGATVRVLLFGRLREDQGWRERLVELPQPVTTVAQLQQVLDIHCPGLRWAVNQDFATPDHPLQPGDELAFLPPITGG
ncbi:MAG: molybdopterin converting factor subunit 1 [Cyanobacteria bacterium MAG IRC3_bin_20]|nr:molybdopterin converting factor subunit 1 [Cyanobacteria bacterium MAG IRC3_bin_20]